MPDTWAIYTIIGLLAAILAVLIYSAYRQRGEGKLPSWVVREPLRVRAAAATIMGALVVLLASIGIDIAPELQAGIVGLVAAVAVAISELTRPRVTPVADPRIE